MTTRFGSSEDRIARAEENLDALKAALRTYYEAGGCLITGEYKPNPDGRTGEIHDLSITIPEIDARLNTLIGELLHNARTALHHLAWELILDAGGKRGENTGFPLRDTDPGTDKKGQRRVPSVGGAISQPARTLIASAQPYQWGPRYRNHPLWRLHQLWNIDKHRYVIARGTHTGFYFYGSPFPPFTFTSSLVSTTEYGAELALRPEDPTVDVKAHVSVQIAINEPKTGIEAPLLPTLEQAVEAVRNLVDAASVMPLP